MATSTTTLTLVDRTAFVWSQRLLGIALVGYLLFDRAFAWLHVPGLPLFFGEIMLVAGALVILTTVRPLRIAWAEAPPVRILAAFMAWGVLLFPTGFLTWGQDAVRDSAIWYYGLTAFIAAYLVSRDAAVLDRAMDLYGSLAPWVVLWLPLSVFANAVLKDIGPQVPDSSVPLLAHRPGNTAIHAAMIIVASFSFLDAQADDHGYRLRRAWITGVGVLTILFAGVQNRGGLFAGMLGLGVFALMMQRRKRTELVLSSLGLLIAIGSIALVFDLRVSVFDNEREVSVEGVVDNITSVFTERDASTQRGNTTDWRLDLWQRVLTDVVEDSPAFGFGFGENIRERYGEQDEDPRRAGRTTPT